MGLKDLPNSLVTAVAEVVSKSSQAKQRLAEELFDEALQKFGVKSVSELTESDLKILSDWVQNQYNHRSSLFESSCGCDSEKSVNEDDMPGDSVYHKDGEESGEKKKELDEEDEDSESVVAEDSRSDSLKVVRSALASSEIKSKVSAHLSKITSAPKGKERANVANKILNLLGKDSGFLNRQNVKFNKALGKVVLLATDSKANLADLESAVKKALAALNESVAQFSDEIATDGAVGVADAALALPKHADVIRDCSPAEGTSEYRLLIQFATNEGTQIVPPTSLPGAPTIADLRTLVAGLPYYNEKIEDALLAAEAIFDESPLA